MLWLLVGIDYVSAKCGCISIELSHLHTNNVVQLTSRACSCYCCCYFDTRRKLRTFVSNTMLPDRLKPKVFANSRLLAQFVPPHLAFQTTLISLFNSLAYCAILKRNRPLEHKQQQQQQHTETPIHQQAKQIVYNVSIGNH